MRIVRLLLMFSAAVAAACALRAERMQTVCRGDTVIEIDAGEGTYSDDFWTQNCDGRTLAEVAGQWQASYKGRQRKTT